MIMRQIGADLRSHLEMNILLGVVCAAAVFLVMAAGALPSASNDIFQTTEGELNGATDYIRGDREVLSQIATEDPAVISASAPAPAVGAVANVAGERWEVMALGFDAPPEFAQPLIREGRFPASSGEALVDSGLMKEAGISVGERLTIEAPGRRIEFTVAGSMLYIGAARFPTDAARIIVPAADVPRIDPGHVWQIAANIDPAVDALSTIGPAEAASLSGSSSDDIAESFNETAIILSSVLASLGLLAILVAGLTIANAVGGRVLAEQQRIGLLRAIGRRPRELARIYVGQFALVAAIGAAVGVVLGSLGTRQLAAAQSELLGTPAPPFPIGYVVVGALGVVAVAALAAAVPVLRAARRPAAETLRPGNDRRTGRGARGGSVLPVAANFALAGLVQRPLRMVTLVLAVALAAATVSATLYYEETITNAAATEGLEEANGFVVAGSAGAEERAALLDASPLVAEWSAFDANDQEVGSAEELRNAVAAFPTSGTTGQELQAALDVASSGTIGVVRNTDGAVGLLTEIRTVTRPVTLVLVLTALISLVGTTFLQVAERRRDLAIAKTLGMSPGGVMRVVLLAAAIPAAVGIAIGLAGGDQLLRVIMSASGGADTLPYISAPAPLAFVGAGVVLVALMVLAVVPTAVGAGRLRPIEALRQVG